MISDKYPHILFLTTQNPADIKAEWPYYQNWTLPRAIAEHGATVSIRCWKDQSLDTSALAKFDVITFLWCNNYHSHAPEFISFLKDILTPVKKLNPNVRIVNDAAVILWNLDKEIYLTELEKEGFLVPETVFIRDIQQQAGASKVKEHLASLAGSDIPVVLKPSISGSSKQTHLIRIPSKLSPADENFLKSIFEEGIDGSLLIQKYEPAIKAGEYSMIFVNGKHTHTMLKTPSKTDFRVQAEFGGGIEELRRQDVPAKALQSAETIVRWMEQRFTNVTGQEPAGEGLLASLVHGKKRIVEQLIKPCLGGRRKATSSRHGSHNTIANQTGVVYLRVDGVVREDGDFVLMEVEAIEPHLWMETSESSACREELYKALLGVPELLPATPKTPIVTVSEMD